MAATVHEALAAVMADVEGVAKRDENTQHGFRFRGIDAILNAVGPVLRRHQVIVLPVLDELRETVVEVGRNRTRMAHATVLVTYRFVGPDGSSLDCMVPGEAMDSGDKAASKAMSVAFRTALIQALALPTDEPDPDATSYERSDGPVDNRVECKRELVALLEGHCDDPRAVAAEIWGRLVPEGATHVDDGTWSALANEALQTMATMEAATQDGGE